MKIRIDFVTNSSSSSFISVSIRNKEMLDKLKDGQAFQEITGFLNEDEGEEGLQGALAYYEEENDLAMIEKTKREIELNNKYIEIYEEMLSMDSCDCDPFEQMFEEFTQTEKSALEAYLKLIEIEGGLKARLDDVSFCRQDTASGEVFGDRSDIEREYGIICDGVTYEEEIFYREGGRMVNRVTVFDDINGLNDELVDKIINGTVSAFEHFSKIKTTDRCLSEIVAALQKGLAQKGKNEEEIKVLLDGLKK